VAGADTCVAVDARGRCRRRARDCTFPPALHRLIGTDSGAVAR
jgi:hypothetical protein